MNRKPLALLVLAGLLSWSAPALAQDNDTDLEDPNSCGAAGGGTVPEGTAIFVYYGTPTPALPPGVPPTLPSSDGMSHPAMWVCMGGHWTYGGTFLELPLAADATSVQVAEGSKAVNTGTYADDDGSLVTFSSTLGTAVPDSASTWSWSATPDDGPATKVVSVTATKNGGPVLTSFELQVSNVPPTVTSLVPATSTAVTGQPVTFTGTATDPSAADTAAGFTWAVSGGATQAFDACGSHTVTGTATDKDGGTSDPVTSAPVRVVDASFAAPLTEGVRNLVQSGQVVPVKVSVGCAGSQTTGLAPAISLLAGDVDPVTTSDDPASLVLAASTAAADSAGVMRQVSDGYLYNLKVPKAPAGSLFTVRVRPFSGGGLVQTVLQVR